MKPCSSGFTLIEMTLVLIMIGILTASLAPILLRGHGSTLEARDRLALEEAKTAIITYAITFGGIPNPGGDIAAVSGVMPGLSAFGVNHWGAFGSSNLTNPLQFFQLDVHDTLRSSAITLISNGVGTPDFGDRVVFCQAVNAAIAASNKPYVCRDVSTDHYNAQTACAFASAVPVAFVLFSTGNDRKPNMGNDPALGANRIYENDKRGINNLPGASTIASRSHSHYDDQVTSYSLSALARDCREKMGIAPEVMNCAAGQKYVGSLSNGLAASSVAYSIAPTATYASMVPANFTSYLNSCFSPASYLAVSGVALAASSVAALDANRDGRIDIYIGAASAVSSQ